MSRGTRKPYERPERRSRADTDQWLHDKAPGFSDRSTTTQPAIQSEPVGKLIISNLHYSVNEKDLSKIFGVIGTLAKEPVIRYDRSGRSTGTAFVAYSSAADAAKAKQQLDGVAAKGEQMQIAIDTRGPPGPRGGSKLIDRIGRPPLSERLSDASMSMDVSNNGPGPVRSRTPRGGRGGRGGKRDGPRTPSTKTLEDLDKELEAFMGDSESKPTEVATADVAMS